MAYGVKYRTAYKRRSNNTTTIDILKNGYAGGITTLVADYDALEIDFAGNIENIYTPTIGSGAVIRVIASPLTLTELFTGDPQEYIVKIYNGASGSNLVWQGFVSPEIYSEDYSSSLPVPIQIQCNDGMQTLEYIKYKTSADAYYTGTTILATVFYQILSKLNISFNNIYTSSDIRIAEYSYNPFLYLKIPQENFIDESGVAMTCRQVLDSVVGGMGLIMKFKADSIYLIDPINLHTPSKGKWYGIIGSYPYVGYNETPTNIGGYLDISAGSIDWYETGQVLDFVPAYSEVQVKYNPYNYSDSKYDFNANGNFSGGTFVDSSGWFVNTGVKFNGWTSNNTGGTNFIGMKETTTDLPIYAVMLGNSAKSAWYTFPYSNITQDQNLKLKISMEVYLVTKNVNGNLYASGTTHDIWFSNIPVSVKIGNQYWKGGNTFSSGTTGNYRQLLSVYQTGKVNDIPNSRINDTWTTASITVPLGQSYEENLINGYVNIEILDSIKTFVASQILPTANATYVSRIYLRNIKAELLDASTGVNVGNDGKLFKANLSTNLTLKKVYEIKTTSGTGVYGSSRAAFKTDQQPIQGTNIQGLQRSGSTTYYNTAKLILQSFQSQYKIPRYKLNGNLDVSSLMLGTDIKLIKDSTYLGTKAFYIISGKYNDCTESMIVEMVEITNTRESI
jgi:hypothetical protein